MNKTQQILKSREEEFDKEFDWAISQNSRFNEVETYIKSFHATTISLLLNSLKESCCEDCRKIIEKHETF